MRKAWADGLPGSGVGEGEKPAGLGAVAVDGRRLTRRCVGSGDGGARRGGSDRRSDSGLQRRLGGRRRREGRLSG
jgi:hypothetical protein